MASQLTFIGYEFEPSKYPHGFGFSGLNALISGQPSQRYFDVKILSVPTFDGRFFHQTQVTRHELEPIQTFQICAGEVRLESFRSETLLAFSFGGTLKTSIQKGDLLCELSSNAPLFKFQDDPGAMGSVIADEILDLLATIQSQLPGDKDDLYARLAKQDPYQVFLACLVSLRKHVDSLPTNLRRERLVQLTNNLNHGFQILRETDGWDGNSPTLQELLSSGGA